ncbi:MAG: O-antigen ligase family protein [Oceanobacter sp.]
MSLALQRRFPQAVLASSICLLIAVVWKLVPHPAVVMVFSLIPFALVFVLHVPFLMVLLFVAFSFFRLHEVFPQLYSLKIPLMLSLASLFALFWHIGLSRKIQVYWRKEFVTLSIFFLLVVVGVIMASNRPIAINYFKGIYWKIALMTYAIAWLSRTASDFSLTSRLITVSGIMVGAVAISNKLAGIGLVEETRVTIGRAIGSVLGDPNDLALVLMFPMSFAVSLIMAKGSSRANRWLGVFAVPVLFWAVLATQSRGGLLGIMSIFGIYGYRRIQNKVLFFGIGAVAAAILYLAAGISGRASGGAEEEGLDASAKGRLYAWEAAFGMAVHNPLTGVGLDNFYSNYYFYSPHWDGLNHAVHSTWFGVLAETGFLGLGVFITLIVQLMLTALRTLNRIEASPIPVPSAVHSTAMAVFAGLMGTIVSGTFLTQGFTWPIYILTAQVIAVANWADKNLPPIPPSSKGR